MNRLIKWKLQDRLDRITIYYMLSSACAYRCLITTLAIMGTQRQFSENICSEEDLWSRIFGTFVVKFLACLALLGLSNIYKMV